MTSNQNLVKELIENGYLKSPNIIKAFYAIDRLDFVLPEYKNQAYGNYPLPIGDGQTISQPLTIAFMLELLDPQPGEKILDVGSGSGWTTALMANLVLGNEISGPGQVLGIERMPKLCDLGKKNLTKYFSEERVKIFCRDGTLGLVKEAPFNKILAGATASKNIPEAWRNQLSVGGKIVAPVKNSIWLFEKIKTGAGKIEWKEKEFSGFMFVPLIKEKTGHAARNSKRFDNAHNPWPVEGQTQNDRSDQSQNSELLRSGFRSYHHWKKSLFIFGFGILVLGGLLTNEIYFPHTSYKDTQKIIIGPGLGSREIGALLKEKGAIRSRWAFVIYLSASARASKLKPGTYVFGQSTMYQIARDLTLGENNEITITIPEGWNIKEIGEYLIGKEVLEGSKFEKTASFTGVDKFRNQFDFLKEVPKNLSLEGYLFPDTYNIYKDSPADDITFRMLKNFNKKIDNDLQDVIKKQNKTIFEIIIMASLIEKEVVSDEDRALVSGILWKRLRAGIPLQVDATVAFARRQTTEDKRPIRTTKISMADTKIDSPYNTYKYLGLPKGPIANPGLSAIKTAIYPKTSPHLYYLSAPNGKTIFSKTLEEHNIAKAKYLK